jgi:hypothetical protein
MRFVVIAPLLSHFDSFPGHSWETDRTGAGQSLRDAFTRAPGLSETLDPPVTPAIFTPITLQYPGVAMYGCGCTLAQLFVGAVTPVRAPSAA